MFAALVVYLCCFLLCCFYFVCFAWYVIIIVFIVAFLSILLLFHFCFIFSCAVVDPSGMFFIWLVKIPLWWHHSFNYDLCFALLFSLYVVVSLYLICSFCSQFTYFLVSLDIYYVFVLLYCFTKIVSWPFLFVVLFLLFIQHVFSVVKILRRSLACFSLSIFSIC